MAAPVSRRAHALRRSGGQGPPHLSAVGRSSGRQPPGASPATIPGPGGRKKKVVEQAPQRLRAPERRPLTLRLLGGLVLWITSVYCGPAARTGKRRRGEGGGLYPELAVLGVS